MDATETPPPLWLIFTRSDDDHVLGPFETVTLEGDQIVVGPRLRTLALLIDERWVVQIRGLAQTFDDVDITPIEPSSSHGQGEPWIITT